MKLTCTPLILLAVLSSLSACGLVDRTFFYPVQDPELAPPADLGEVTVEAFQSKDGTKLQRWILPAEDPQAIVLQVHGNAVNLGNHIWAVNWLPAEGVEVQAFDYRGFGASEGRVLTRRGPIADTRAALRDAKAAAAEADLPLFVLGQSIGGSLALAALEEDGCEGVDGLILDSTFSSWRRIATDKVGPMVAWLVSDAHSAVDTLLQLPEDFPVIMFHGSEDQIIDAAHYRTLMASVAGRPAVSGQLIRGVGHIDPTASSAQGQHLMIEFIRNHSGTARIKRGKN